MAEYIKTLKEDNGDITYPVTKSGAVLLNNGSDLETELTNYVTAEDIASTADVDHPITTGLIADGAVTAAKLAPGIVTMTRTTIYTGDTNGDITLSSAWSNFDQIEIHYYAASGSGGTADRIMTLPGTCTNFTLEHNNAGGSSTLYANYGRYAVSGTTLTHSSNHYQKNIAASAVSTNAYNYVHVTKIVGIKFREQLVL